MPEAAQQDGKLNVFISYSRDDLAFADQLDASLQLGGFETTIDRRGISAGEDWKARLGSLIRDADTVVFVLSLSSAQSDICAWEVAEAVRLGKRIIPVVCSALGDVKPPQELTDRDYIYFYPEPKFPGSGFGPGLLRLATALNTDLDWSREHTRYLRLATEWEEVGKPPDRRLLSAADIALAKAWATSRPPKAPELTALQRAFIRASEAEDVRQSRANAAVEIQRREAAERTAASAVEAKKAADARKRMTQVAIAGLVVALLVAAAALWQYFDALAERDRAVKAEEADHQAEVQAQASAEEARSNLHEAQLAQSQFLTNLAQQARAGGDNGAAILLALEALPDAAAAIDRPYLSGAELQLDSSRRNLREWLVLRHDDQLNNAAFSPDGNRIVTASEDKTARIWDVATRRQIGEPLRGHQDGIRSAAFSPDGKRIVTASWDKTARIWDAATGKPIGEPLKGHEEAVNSASFSPDGKRIITASNDKTARIWDADSGRPIGEPLKGHDDAVWSAAFSPDGKRIVTASGDRTARLWDAVTGQTIGEPLKGHEGGVTSAAFSPDGQRVVTASWDRTARIWDVATGRQFARPLIGHRETVISAVFSPDGARIVTASYDRTARIWDAATGQPIGEPLGGHEDRVESAAFSPDGRRILTASWDKTARLWDATLLPIVPSVLRAAFSPDGRRVVAASADGAARIFDSATGKPIGEPLKAHEGAVYSAAFSPDGKRIVTASADKTARIWDAESGKPIGEPLTGHAGAVESAAFSPDGKQIVTASADKTARIWDAESGKPTGEPLKGHDEAVNSASFSPDGKQIVTASGDKTARIWDVATRQTLVELRGHDRGVSSAAFSHDGKRIITASADRTARLWDAATGQLVGELIGHDDALISAEFSPDGERAITASADKTARIWNISTGEAVGEISRPDGMVTSATFSPDGQRIVTASSDWTVRLWDVFPDTQALVSAAKAAVPRCLTQQQRKMFALPPEPPAWCYEMAKWPYQPPRFGVAFKTQGLNKDDGIVVTRVIQNLPADLAGLKADDVILAVDGKSIPDEKSFRSALDAVPPNNPANFVISRNGKTQKIIVMPKF